VSGLEGMAERLPQDYMSSHVDLTRVVATNLRARLECMSVPMESASSPDARTKALVTWGLRALVAFVFTVPAAVALGGQVMVVRQFDAAGLSPWFRAVTSLVQISGAILVLLPPTSLFGAILLLIIDIGALIFQAFVLHGDIVHVILFALPLLALLSIQSGRFDAKLAELDK
jgi:putative oxidoreductase